jgi:hypothetical protein
MSSEPDAQAAREELALIDARARVYLAWATSRSRCPAPRLGGAPIDYQPRADHPAAGAR